ncbi:hypothetical protein Q5P01_011863 [Channa striata]|uniref:Uncharacterized protein n=1 Tax=Channa striata TaxID=64152 RepID=A0AA88SW35_CHASR|nr:hypothetical protein Q5P01_011863 [Channa striata]
MVEAMEGNQQSVDVNILLLGANSVGKSGTYDGTTRFVSVYSQVERIDSQEICFNVWETRYTQLVFHQLAGLIREMWVPRKTNAGVQGIVGSLSAQFDPKHFQFGRVLMT